jgi:endonuclease-3
MESLKKKRERLKIIFETLDPLYTFDKTALKYRSPFQLLIAAILSAQCTDKQVNQVTKPLFKKYKGPEDFLKASVAELEDDIRPTGFFRNKTKTIKGCCQGLVDFHGGKVPSTMEEMVKLLALDEKRQMSYWGRPLVFPVWWWIPMSKDLPSD